MAGDWTIEIAKVVEVGTTVVEGGLWGTEVLVVATVLVVMLVLVVDAADGSAFEQPSSNSADASRITNLCALPIIGLENE